MIILTKYGNNLIGDSMKKQKKSKIKKFLISILLIGMLGGIGYYLYIVYTSIEVEPIYNANRVSLSTNSEKTVESINENDIKIEEMLEHATKSVCGISKLKTTGGSILSKATEDELGLGTGIIVSDKGYILSNTHVTGEKYSTCYITIEDGETYMGTVVWADVDLDLSITKINANNLKVAKLGDSTINKIGQTVYAIGNPIGYEFRRTITSGIISALNRTVKIDENNETSYMSNLIQTDATINPGNSGGPLINVNGEVIGINSVKITSADGMGFAIPINVIKPIINSFNEKESFDEAYIGIAVYDKQIAQYLNLNDRLLNGIYVCSITTNGPASKTELKEKDIIESIDGNKIYTTNELREYIYSKLPGDTIVLNIKRGKISKEINIVLEKK